MSYLEDVNKAPVMESEAQPVYAEINAQLAQMLAFGISMEEAVTMIDES